MLKTFYVKTFGCQMNYADSEKITMILISSGFRKVVDPTKADIIILNTCSVRQKGEDKVFGFMREITRFHKNRHTELVSASSDNSGDPEILQEYFQDSFRESRGASSGGQEPSGGQKQVLFGITGCMVRKSGVAKRYLQTSFAKEVPTRDEEAEDFSDTKSPALRAPSLQKRVGAKKITLLSTSQSLLNYDDELFLRSPLIDFTFRIEEVSFVTKILSHITGEDIGNDAKWNEYLAVKQLQENPASANIIIQTGCDNFCTFCIVPHTRGRETSRSQDEIISEIQEVVSKGTKEVTLLGQNVNSYGKESRAKLWNSEELTWTNKEVKTPFRELLDEINTIEGLDRIRFTSSNPHDMTRDILDAHFELPKMCHYLHFALQSGNDTMLKRMNRKHSYEDFKSQVDYLRSNDPLFSISTDIIVGFPGETEEEFEATAQAMRECQFDFAFIARYNSRSGTVATAKYKDDISPEEKARRWTILNDILRETVHARNALMVGRTEEILISGEGKDETWVGRTRNWKEVFIPKSPEMKVGDIVKVKIIESEGWVLQGRKF